jgi:hypothetical protein
VAGYSLWLDCNSDELGTYYDVDLQRQGKLVWPRLDVDPQDPQSLDYMASAMDEKGLWFKVDDGNSAVSYSSGWTTYTNKAAIPTYKIMVRSLGRILVLSAAFSGTPFTINILDLSGRLVQRIGVKENSIATSTSQHMISKGVYIINCRTANMSVSQKIVKVR